MDKISFIFFFASSSLPPASWKLLTWGWWLLSGRLPCGSRDFFFHLLFPLFCFALLCFASLFYFCRIPVTRISHFSNPDWLVGSRWRHRIHRCRQWTQQTPAIRLLSPIFYWLLAYLSLLIGINYWKVFFGQSPTRFPVSIPIIFFFSGDLLAAFINQIFCCLFVFRDWFLFFFFFFFFFFLLLCLFAVGPLFRFSAFLNHSGRFQSNRRRWFTVA